MSLLDSGERYVPSEKASAAFAGAAVSAGGEFRSLISSSTIDLSSIDSCVAVTILLPNVADQKDVGDRVDSSQ